MTFKQTLVARKLVEYNGEPLGKIMVEAGYAPSTATNPQKLTESKAWPALMEKYFPDTLLSKRHKQLLNKKEFFAVGEKGDRRIEPTGEIDPAAVARGLEMAYKLKNKYPVEKSGGDTSIAIVNVVRFGEAKKDDNVA